MKGIRVWYYLGVRILQKQPGDLLPEPELLTELLGVVGLHMERCTLTKEKKAVSKGHQVIRSSIIQLLVI